MLPGGTRVSCVIYSKYYLEFPSLLRHYYSVGSTHVSLIGSVLAKQILYSLSQWQVRNYYYILCVYMYVEISDHDLLYVCRSWCV